MPDRDTVIAMAAEAGFPDCTPENHKIVASGDLREVHEEFLTLLGRFAALVAAQERELCAVLCEENQVMHKMGGTKYLQPFYKECQGTHEGMVYAASIRARKEET